MDDLQTQQQPHSGDLQPFIAELIRKLLAAWLIAVTIEYILLPEELRSLEGLEGLEGLGLEDPEDE